MSYPMLGDGNNTYSRVKPTWETLHHITVLTHVMMHATDLTDITLDIRRPIWSGGQPPGPRVHCWRLVRMIQLRGRQSIWNVISRFSNVSNYDNAFYMPHAGAKWGNKFEVLTFKPCRLKRNGRKSFTPIKKGHK